MNAYVSSGSYLVTPCKREHQSFVLVLYPLPPLTFVMASKLDKDDYVYDIDNITALMASMDAASLEAGGLKSRNDLPPNPREKQQGNQKRPNNHPSYHPHHRPILF